MLPKLKLRAQKKSLSFNGLLNMNKIAGFLKRLNLFGSIFSNSDLNIKFVDTPIFKTVFGVSCVSFNKIL